jgi:hypothetical protein
MTSRTIRTESELAGWGRFLACQPLPFTVSYAKGIKRSNQQSRTAEKWYQQIGSETGETQAEVKGQCKLMYGLPIMERDNGAWVEEWYPFYGPLPHVMRAKLFQVLPLTSLLTTRQMAEFMDAVQKEYRGQGIELIDPEALRMGDFVPRS